METRPWRLLLCAFAHFKSESLHYASCGKYWPTSKSHDTTTIPLYIEKRNDLIRVHLIWFDNGQSLVPAEIREIGERLRSLGPGVYADQSLTSELNSLNKGHIECEYVHATQNLQSESSEWSSTLLLVGYLVLTLSHLWHSSFIFLTLKFGVTFSNVLLGLHSLFLLLVPSYFWTVIGMRKLSWTVLATSNCHAEGLLPQQHPTRHVQSKQTTQWGSWWWDLSPLRHGLCAFHSIPWMYIYTVTYKTVAMFWSYAMFGEYLYIEKTNQHKLNVLKRVDSQLSNKGKIMQYKWYLMDIQTNLCEWCIATVLLLTIVGPHIVFHSNQTKMRVILPDPIRF